MRAINTKANSRVHCEDNAARSQILSSWHTTQAEFRHIGSKRSARLPVQTHGWTDVSILASHHASTHLEKQSNCISASVGWGSPL